MVVARPEEFENRAITGMRSEEGEAGDGGSKGR